MKPVRPSRWRDYVFEDDYQRAQDGKALHEFPLVIPYSAVDARIMDLALGFWHDPDDRLLKAYRRLEDIVRKRTGIGEHGSRLFSAAFVGPNARLSWKDTPDGERTGKANLFTAAYMAHRNPRAHRELRSSAAEQLSEFLLLNHLYLLECESHDVAESAQAA